MRYFMLTFLFLNASEFLSAGETQREIRAADIKAHVTYLASDELEGRGSGTEGNKLAAEYIADHFQRWGLQPAGTNGTFFQPFEFASGVELGASNSLAFKGKSISPEGMQIVPDVDFRPLGFSSNGTVTGELMFAGYGVSAADLGYDDYSGPNVEGKILVVFRYTPEGSDPHSEWYKHGSFRTKARVARDHGATALIIVTGPQDDPADDLVPLSFDQTASSSGIPIISMKYSRFDEVLQTRGLNCELLQDSIKQSGKPVSLDLGDVTVTLQTDVNLVQTTTSNVIGYLPGLNENQKDRFLVIGAHMDHLGWGGPGSGSLEPDTHEIHNGADDNASGTAALLELAEDFALGSNRLPIGLVFIAFSGEELGTLGSAYYVENPTIDLKKTDAMINMDMIGRLREKSLTVYGTGTSPDWPQLLNEVNKDSTFALSFVDDGYGPSDHAQFYEKEIPVLFFFTGSHNEYHKPSDDPETLNYEGAESVALLVSRITSTIGTRDEKLPFTHVASTSPASGGSENRQFSVTLGVIPDYSADVEGMKIGGVRPDGPAEKAGLQPGDTILGMKGKKILNIYDYMDILGELKAGETVEIDVLRGEERVTFSATMQARK